MKVHHIGYLIKDMDSSIATFKALGYKIEKNPSVDGIRDATIAFMILHNCNNRIELICPFKTSPLYALLKHYKNQPYHICFEVERIKEMEEYLRRRGYMVIKKTERAPCMDDGDVEFFFSSDIGIIELYERKKSEVNDNESLSVRGSEDRRCGGVLYQYYIKDDVRFFKYIRRYQSFA